LKPGKIRPLAICIFLHENRILVSEGYDQVKKQTFYRPLGGKIEFGETGEETVRRELLEEIGAESQNLQFLGVLESIFTYNGEQGHEIVLVYDGDFRDQTLYDQKIIHGLEIDQEFSAVWKNIDFFASGQAPLYPDGLLKLISAKTEIS
jgi:8-oxo-dGTP pyrophosphatase MutT (NUDIX family)